MTRVGSIRNVPRIALFCWVIESRLAGRSGGGFDGSVDVDGAASEGVYDGGESLVTVVNCGSCFQPRFNISVIGGRTAGLESHERSELTTLPSVIWLSLPSGTIIL